MTQLIPVYTQGWWNRRFAIQQWRGGKLLTSHPIDDTDDTKRGNSLTAALSAAQAGDVFQVPDADYDIGGEWNPVASVSYNFGNALIYQSNANTPLINVPIADGAVYRINGGHWDNRGLDGGGTLSSCIRMEWDGGAGTDVSTCHFYPASVTNAGASCSAVYLAQGRLIGHIPRGHAERYDVIEVNTLSSPNVHVSLTAGYLTHAGATDLSNGVEVVGRFTPFVWWPTGSITVDLIENYGEGPAVNVSDNGQCAVHVNQIVGKTALSRLINLAGTARCTFNSAEMEQDITLDPGRAGISYSGSDNNCSGRRLSVPNGLAVNFGSGQRNVTVVDDRAGGLATGGPTLATPITTLAEFQNQQTRGNFVDEAVPISTTTPTVEDWAHFRLYDQADASKNGLYLYDAEADANKQISGEQVVVERIACSDEDSDLETGKLATFRTSSAMDLFDARAALTNAGAGGVTTIDLRVADVTIFSTKITIDDGEKTSTTATNPPVFSTAFLPDDTEVDVYAEQLAPTPGSGLKVALFGIRR